MESEEVRVEEEVGVEEVEVEQEVEVEEVGVEEEVEVEEAVGVVVQVVVVAVLVHVGWPEW